MSDQAVHAIFAGPIDEHAVARLGQGITSVMANGVTEVHLLFQSAGGFVGDGVCLYNLFRALPIDLTLYNCGTVCSIATLAYLGASHRKTSAHATFMIHRTHMSPQAATAGRLERFAHNLALDDTRTTNILRARTNLSEAQWDIHKTDDLWLSAGEAVEAGIATEIGDFAPVLGQPVYFV